MKLGTTSEYDGNNRQVSRDGVELTSNDGATRIQFTIKGIRKAARWSHVREACSSVFDTIVKKLGRRMRIALDVAGVG
jgi:hypothetical protein